MDQHVEAQRRAIVGQRVRRGEGPVRALPHGDLQRLDRHVHADIVEAPCGASIQIAAADVQHGSGRRGVDEPLHDVTFKAAPAAEPTPGSEAYR
jgi:hypothetical protein